MAITVTARRDAAITNPIKVKTAVHLDVTGLTDHNSDGTQRVYRMVITGPGDDLRSHAFTPSSDGKHTWDDVVFPDSGSFNVDVWLLNNSTGAESSSVKTQAVTVAAS